AMDDDINTPAAIASLQELRGEANRLLRIGLSRSACLKVQETFRSLGGVLGLFQLKDWQFNAPVADSLGVGLNEIAHVADVITDTDVESKIAERNEARRLKDFARADEIRQCLAAQGITIEDRPDGTSRWKR
ncbi:MAG: DALR domain-containing protein, partial [Nitrospiraceae bacterium]